MNGFDVSKYMPMIIEYGTKLIGAILVFIIGRIVINWVCKLVSKALEAKKFDPTLSKYLQSTLRIVLLLVLVMAVLGMFGIQTTSFAAILASAGVAIGMAWSGLLANFAAGVFMVVLRPFKAGDFVQVGGQLGTVREIGILVTVVDTMDNVRTIIGNKKVFDEPIQNFTENPVRRVDLVAQLNHGVDHNQAMSLLKEKLKQIPNVAAEPAPCVEILEFNLAGPVLAVRPFVHNDYYWDVYFATNKVIKETFGAAKFPVPENHYVIRKTM